MFKGFEIEECEDGFTWAHSSEIFSCEEDVAADIEDYLDGAQHFRQRRARKPTWK